MLVPANVPTDPHGNGWVDVAVPDGMKPVNVSILDAAPGTPAPQADGERYDTADAHFTIGAPAGHIRVEVTDGEANSTYGVTVEFGTAA